MSMTQEQMLADVSEKAGISKTAAADFFKALKQHINEQLAAGEEVRLNGLGKFRPVVTAPRKARNPRTGDTMNIPSGKKVKFYAAKELKDSVL